MKVILLKDVAKIGKRFSIAEVPDGYALNKLIPTGQAQAATKANIEQLKKRQVRAGQEAQQEAARFKEEMAQLQGKTVTVAAEANEQGHLFRALQKEAVISALAALGAKLDAAEVLFAEPIKSVGEHTVTISAGGESESLPVVVISK